MTAAASLPVLVPAGGGDRRQRRDQLELLSALIGGPGFDPLLRGDIIAFPRDHPVFWWGCRITGCERPRRENKTLCAGHEAQCRDACLAGADRAAWLRDAAPLALTYARVPEPRRICGHRPAVRGVTRLCARHQHRWKDARGKAGGAGFEEWLWQRKTLDRFEHQHGRPPGSAERARLALFPSPVRNPHGTRAISYHTFQSRFRQWVDQLDLGASCAAHQARHTLATRLLAHGAGLHHIRRYLGHVSIRMTEHYAKVATSEIEDILQHIGSPDPEPPTQAHCCRPRPSQWTSARPKR